MTAGAELGGARDDRAVCDVAIVGGGLVGASLAIALGATPLRVALIEAAAAGSGPAAPPSFDDRTTALGNATRRIFESLGVWSTVAAEAAAIERIHVSEAGRPGFARIDAREQGVAALGYVVTNRSLGRALHAQLERLERVRRLMPARLEAMRIGEQHVELEVRDATSGACSTLRARLVVAADGADSAVRAAAGLDAEVESYGQVAVIAHVASERRADGTAYERFTPRGPLAVLPLASGSHGIVWTLPAAQSDGVLQLPDEQFLAQLQQSFGWRIGRLSRVGRRAAYPLQLSRASALVARRTVLIGNAAQALHPAAGQGFNLGLRDVATLAETLATAFERAGGIDVGAAAVLDAFARARATDRETITRFTDGLVKLFGDERKGLPLLRSTGLLLFDLLPPAKSALSRLSWGFGESMPRLARGLSLVRPQLQEPQAKPASGDS